MARPIRCRRICFEPKYDSFAPCGAKSKEQVLLMVDEFEAVRLIDHEKKTHEQCARQMGISRTTVTEMYERARTKIADCLVGGKTLCISGGNYALCDGSAWRCCGKKCDRAKHIAEIARAQVVDTNGSGHGALAGMLSARNVDKLLAGNLVFDPDVYCNHHGNGGRC